MFWNLIFAFVASVSLTQAAPAKGSLISKEDLSKKLAFYRDLDALKVPFVQTKTVKSANLSVKVRGVLEVQFPNQVKWSIVQPGNSEVLITDSSIKVSSLEAGKWKTETYSLKDPKLNDVTGSLRVLSAWLKLDVETIAKLYKATETAPNTFRFVPNSPDSSPFSELTMELKKAGQVEKLVLQETSGDSLSFQFMNPEVKRAQASSQKKTEKNSRKTK